MISQIFFSFFILLACEIDSIIREGLDLQWTCLEYWFEGFRVHEPVIGGWIGVEFLCFVCRKRPCQ